MTQIKKLVYGGLRGFASAMAKCGAKGWAVVRTYTVPRGDTGREIYIAELKRDKQ